MERLFRDVTGALALIVVWGGLASWSVIAEALAR